MDTPLPALHQGDLTDSQVAQLFDELERCAAVHGVSTKGGLTTSSRGEVVTLGLAQDLLRTRAVRGVQVRYTYEGRHWLDTLMVHTQGIRVVRIEVPD